MNRKIILVIGLIFSAAVLVIGHLVLDPSAQKNTQLDEPSILVLNSGCEENIRKASTARNGNPIVFENVIWNVSAETKLSGEIRRVAKNHYRVDVNTTGSTGHYRSQNCAGRTGIKYRLTINRPSNISESDNIAVRMYENGDYTGCVFSNYRC